MKIAVNTRLLLKNALIVTGTTSFNGCLGIEGERISGIWKNEPEGFEASGAIDLDHAGFTYPGSSLPALSGVDMHIRPGERHPYLWYLFFEHGIPLKLRKIKPDLFLSTDGWIPTRLDIPTVNVIHDLNFLHHPEFVPPVVRRYYDRFFPKFARNATRLATVSQFSCDDIHQSYQVPTERIDVVYNGANQAYRPYTEEEQSAVKQHYTDGKDYFLFVGLIHKRKNLANIFRAFELFKERTGSPMKLVVVGDKKWWAGEIEDTYLAIHYRKDVVMLGRQ